VLVPQSHGAVTELRMATGFLGRGMYWVSAFQVEGLLVDAGPPHTARQLRAWLHEHPIQAALLTHHHEDHVGGAQALPCVPLAPPTSLARLARPPRTQLFRQIIWGRSRPVEAGPISGDAQVGGLRVRVIPTPGHSDDHVAYLFPDRGWLFTGDLFVHERVRYAQGDENVPRALQSLRRVLTFEFDDLYCAHGGRIHQPQQALLRKIEFLEEVRERAVELRQAGLAPDRIARRVFGRLGPWHYVTGGWFSEVNLIRSLLEDDAG